MASANSTTMLQRTPLDQIYQTSVLQTFPYKNQKQDPFALPDGRVIRSIILQGDITYTTTAGTLHPHPAGLLNMIRNFTVKTNGGQVLTALSGMDIWQQFVAGMQIAMDNVDLVGAAAQTSTARVTVEIPYFLEDGLHPEDGILETVQKKVNAVIEYNDPLINGTLFGDVTGLSAITATWQVISTEFSYTNDVLTKVLLPNTVQRTLVASDVPVTTTNDQLRIDNQIKVDGVLHRKWGLMPRSTSNGILVPDGTVLDPTKKLNVKSTAGNSIIQENLIRVLRGQTMVRRKQASLPAGQIDVNFTSRGSTWRAMPSTQAGEVYLLVPGVTNGNSPLVRVMTDTIQHTAAVLK